jgi:glycosyltransferase involved in cell wall biosynthesis
MRVLFVCMHLKTGGVERQWSILAAALRERGFDTGVLTLRAEGEFFGDVTRAGVPAHCAHMRHNLDLPGLRRALAFADPPPHIVISNSPSGELVGQAIARRAGAVHVTTDHSLHQSMRTRQRLAQRLVATRADGCIAVTARQIPFLAKRGYRRERITIVSSGIPEPQLSRSRAAVRAELGLMEDDFAAFLIATLRPEKRPELFVGAVAAAHAVDSRIRGFVVGRGRLQEHVRSLAACGGGVVEVLGDRSDVPDLLGAADAVCLSSNREALPMVLIEAMAAGRAVVATAVGGIPDLVVDGLTGDLVAPESEDSLARALVELAADGERRRSYEGAARARYRELYTVDRMVDGYAGLFQGLVQQPQLATATLARAT